MSEGHEPQIMLPPPELLLGHYREELARLSNENFELKTAAVFQSGVISQLQIQLAAELEKNGDSESEESDI